MGAISVIEKFIKERAKHQSGLLIYHSNIVEELKALPPERQERAAQFLAELEDMVLDRILRHSL